MEGKLDIVIEHRCLLTAPFIVWGLFVFLFSSHCCFCNSLLFFCLISGPSFPVSHFPSTLQTLPPLHQSTLKHQSLSTPPTSSRINCQFSIHETSPQFPKRSERGGEMECESESGGERATERERKGEREFNYFLSLLRTQTSCPLSSLGN